MHPSKEAEINAEKQRMLFVFGDIKSDLLKSFRAHQFAYLFEETADGNHLIKMNTAEEPVWDDILAGSFKVGDNFTCQIRMGKTETFFQAKYGKNITNLYDPERYFRPQREEGKPDLFMFVKSTGITILALSEVELKADQAIRLLKKEARGVIGYDKHDNVVIKKSAAKRKAPGDEWSFGI